MTKMEQLEALYAEATKTRDTAHTAYTLALKAQDGSSEAAYETLCQANKVMRMVYAMKIEEIISLTAKL